MSYSALYRVFRPQKFADVVGQEVITTTLKNAVIERKISHAYLFTGPRGTGKTSVARILAKAINCHDSVFGEPCGECSICRAIKEGELTDIIEIDAASNNGVEEIRNLRDTVKYSALVADFKVYIIDEVHMLSVSAFNALLKTLEEPPGNVVFILATTEVHKVLPTIVSRSQRFDFRRISIQDISQYLKNVLAEINVDYEEEALSVIARVAQGGMRDALSILDQAISYANDSLTVENVQVITGVTGIGILDEYLAAVYEKRVKEALNILENILRSGSSAHRFLEDLLLYNRDLLMNQEIPELLIERNSFLTEKFKELSEKIAAEQIYAYINLLGEAQQELRFASNASIYLEILTVKLAKFNCSKENWQSAKNFPVHQEEIDDLRKEIAKLHKNIENLRANFSEVDQKSDAISVEIVDKKKNNSQYKNPTQQIYQVLSSATRESLSALKEVWQDLLVSLAAKHRALLKASEPVAANDTQMLVVYEYDFLARQASADEELKRTVSGKLSKMIGKHHEFIIVTSDEWPKLRKNFLAEHFGELKNCESGSADSASSITEEKATQEAINLFGKDFVNIVKV